LYIGKNSSSVDAVVQFTYPQSVVITREGTDQEFRSD